MIVPNHYEVNVARLEKKALDSCERYYHFFSIEIRDTWPKESVDEKFDIITKAFPSPEYKCTLTRVECHGIIEKEI